MTPQSIVQFIWLLGAMVEIAFIAITQPGSGCSVLGVALGHVFVLVQLFVGEVIASDIISPQLFLDREFICIDTDHRRSMLESRDLCNLLLVLNVSLHCTVTLTCLKCSKHTV